METNKNDKIIPKRANKKIYDKAIFFCDRNNILAY